MKIIITSPSLDKNQNVSGIASITEFIINNNTDQTYVHFESGKRDMDKRNLHWLLRILKSYQKWFRLLLKEKNALVHFNMPLSTAAIIRDAPLIIITRLCSTRMIIHLHGGEFLMHQEMPLWMKLILKICFSGNNPKITLSETEEQILKSRLGIENVVALPNCVDLHDASIFLRDYDRQGKLQILFLGRICEQKGIRYIYQALRLLREKGQKFNFVMAGKGEEEEIYITKFQELLGGDFKFTGVVSGQTKAKLLMESDIFLLPSFFEGLPMALLESMSFGVVPIATDVGSIKYLIKNGKTGILIKKNSSEDIVAAVEELSANSLYMQSLSQNAKDFIFKNYKPELYISRLNQIYNYGENTEFS